MTCYGICEQHRAKFKAIGRKYGDGNKYCTHCTIMITWDGKYCPCCGHQLRIGPRRKMYKERKEYARIG